MLRVATGTHAAAATSSGVTARHRAGAVRRGTLGTLGRVVLGGRLQEGAEVRRRRRLDHGLGVVDHL